MQDPTLTFSIVQRKNQEIRESLKEVYGAMKEKGYNPVNQIVGYILSEDPTYITTHKNARAKMCKLDRDDLLHAMVNYFINE